MRVAVTVFLLTLILCQATVATSSEVDVKQQSFFALCSQAITTVLIGGDSNTERSRGIIESPVSSGQASYGDAMTAYKTLQADIERSLQAESVLSKDSEHCDLSSTGDEPCHMFLAQPQKTIRPNLGVSAHQVSAWRVLAPLLVLIVLYLLK